MLQVTSGFVNTQGLKLHYYRAGSPGKPALVLVHGITDDGLCWEAVATELTQNFDLVMVDLRGHGKSDAPEDDYAMESMASELAGLIWALGLEKPILLGHSMGAMTSLTLAGLYPDLPRALLLEDPPPFWNPPPAQAASQQPPNPLEAWIYANKRKTSDDLRLEAHTNSPTWSEAEIDVWINSKHRYSLNIASILRSRAINAAALASLLQKITCPTLLIHADTARGALVRQEDIAKLRELIPHLRSTHIPGAGHNIRREQFQRYMEVIRQELADS